MQSRTFEAAEHSQEACALVPEAYDSWYLLGMCYRRLGDPPRARHASFECFEAMKRWVKFHPDDTRAWNGAWPDGRCDRLARSRGARRDSGHRGLDQERPGS